MWHQPVAVVGIVAATSMDVAGSADIGSRLRSTKPSLNGIGATRLGILLATAWIPAQSKNVERFDQTVMCRVCAGMLQRNLPEPCLPYAIDISIDKYNLISASTNPVSPRFSMFDKQPAIIWKCFNSKVCVHIPTAICCKVHLHDQCD